MPVQERRCGTPQVGNIPYDYDHSKEALFRPIPPEGKCPEDAHVTVPHPNPELRRKGWRVALIFLPIYAAGCYLLYLVFGG